MGSDTTLRIPTVDLSHGNLKPGSNAWAATRAQIRAALDCFGCFEGVYEGVRRELREAAFGAAKELFALPVEAKVRNVSDKISHGYLGQFPGLPYESLTVDDVLEPAAAHGFTHLMWPQGNPAFCETVCDFAKRAAEVDRMVRRMVLESLGVEKHYDSHMGSTKYVLRLAEYAPPPDPDNEAAKVILAPHVDGGVSALICQNQVHGLEVQAKIGDWVPFTPSSPNSFVYLVGDAFRAWSNDRLHGSPHRVRVGAGETRYCVILFAVPKDEAVVEAPGELVDEGRPPRFRPYRYPEYVEYSAATHKEAGGGDMTSILTSFFGTEGAERSVQA